MDIWEGGAKPPEKGHGTVVFLWRLLVRALTHSLRALWGYSSTARSSQTEACQSKVNTYLVEQKPAL